MDEAKGLARRAFLKRAAAGAGAVGALAAYPSLIGGIVGGETADDELVVPAEGSEPMLIFISDAARGEAVVLSGTSEFLVKDRVLVSRLVRASGVHTG